MVLSLGSMSNPYAVDGDAAKYYMEATAAEGSGVTKFLSSHSLPRAEEERRGGRTNNINSIYRKSRNIPISRRLSSRPMSTSCRRPTLELNEEGQLFRLLVCGRHG